MILHHAAREFYAVKVMLGTGASDYEVARRTGVPRATVRNWRLRTEPPRRGRDPSTSLEEWRPPDGRAYSYLLGLYLGDGCIYATGPTGARIAISLDATYPQIIREGCDALGFVFPGVPVRKQARQGCTVLLLSHQALPYAFPHGQGRKHLRPILLKAWQSSLCARYPESLLRGMIHSDGCRTVNRFRVRLPSGQTREYQYTRYFFSNLSEDIRRIFTDHCDLLDIRWTQSNPRNISIAHRRSVAKLEQLIGPKH